MIENSFVVANASAWFVQQATKKSSLEALFMREQETAPSPACSGGLGGVERAKLACHYAAMIEPVARLLHPTPALPYYT